MNGIVTMKNRSAEQGDRIRVPFRIALSTILAILLLGTVAVIGILSYSNLRKNADGLSSQVLDQTSRCIEMWVGNLLSRAHDQSQLNRATLGQVRLSPKTLTWLGSYWRRVMESQPYFTFLSVGLETGGMLSIEVATEDMKRGLRSFGKYVPADLVREIPTSGEEAVLGGRREKLTVFFSDIKEFSSISERMPPEALVEHLAEDHVNTASRLEGLNLPNASHIPLREGWRLHG